MALFDDLEAKVSQQLAQMSAGPAGIAPSALPVGDDFAAASAALSDTDALKATIRAELAKGIKPKPVEASVSWKDQGLGALGSLGSLGGMAAGLGEYGGRMAQKSDLPELQKLGEEITPAFADMRSKSFAWANEIFSRQSPEAQARASREILTLDPNLTIWQGGPGEFVSSLSLKLGRSLAPTVVPLFGLGILSRLGAGAVASSLYGVSEGALSTGGVAAQISQEVEQMPLEELMESPKFKAIYARSGDEARARQEFITEIQGVTPILAGLAVGAVSKYLGKDIDQVMSQGAGLLTRAGVGYIDEFQQEFVQSGAEQLATNIARRAYANPDALEGVLEQALQGGMVGGPMGGSMAAIFGRGPKAMVNEGPVAPDVAIATNTPPPQPPAPSVRPFSPTPEQGALPGVEAEPRPAEVSNPYMGAPAPPEEEPVDPRAQQYGSVQPDVAEAQFGQRNIFDPVPFELSAQPRPQLALPFENAAGAQRPGPGFQMAGQGPQQPSLGLRDRSTGLDPGAVIEPQPMPQAAPELQAPVNSPVNPFQEDAFPQPVPAGQGYAAPTAEPARDVMAQIADLQDPQSTRKGVYLSKANLDHLQKLRRLDMIDVGVPMPNFDGQGGLMIAKDPETAEDLAHFRDAGAGSLEEVIGLATGAGAGKPLGSNLVVQKLDKQGNVIRERIVRLEERKRVMQEFGEGARTISVPAVMKRRADLIKQEQQERVEDVEVARTHPTAQDRVRREFQGPMTEDDVEDAAQLAAEPGLDEEIGSRLLSYAANVRQSERANRRGLTQKGGGAQGGIPKQLEDIPAPGELKFRGREITELSRQRQAVIDEAAALEDEHEETSQLEPRKRSLSKDQKARIAEIDKKLEDVRLRLHKTAGKLGAERLYSEGVAGEQYEKIYSDLLDKAVAMEMAKDGSEKDAFDAEAAFKEQEKKLKDFIRAEGGYTRSEAIAAAAKRFAPGARKKLKLPSKAKPDADKDIKKLERAQRRTRADESTSTVTAARNYRPAKLSERAQGLVDQLYKYLSPTQAANLKGDEGYAAVEIRALLQKWISAYRMALRAGVPPEEQGSSFRRRNWKVDHAAARLTEMLSRLRSDVGTKQQIDKAAQFVAQEIYFMFRMAGRFGVSMETNPLNFWKSLRAGPVAFRDFLREHATVAEPTPFKEITEEELKRMSPEDVNSLYVRAVETSTRERTSDGQRSEIIRQLLEANTDRYSNKPHRIEGEYRGKKVDRYVSARSLFREHLNGMSLDQLKELYTKGSKVTIKRGRKTVTEEIPPIADTLPPPMPLNVLSRRLPLSEKIKYIMRAGVSEKAQVHGGASRALAFTRKARHKQPGVVQVRRETGYNVGVLTKDIPPRDLTAESRAVHEHRIAVARGELIDATGGSFALMPQLSRGDYQEIADQRDADGELTQQAKDMVYGRAYFRWLHSYAGALLRANLQSKDGATEMERVAKDLRRFAKLSAKKFVEETSSRMRAEFREQVLTVARSGGTEMQDLRDPAKRAALTEEQHRRAHNFLLDSLRFDSELPLRSDTGKNESWVQNERFQQNIAPVLRKISDSLLRDGWPSYEPTQQEKDVVRSQLETWRRYRDTREKFYRPLSEMLRDAGFFDRDQALLKRFAQHHPAASEVEVRTSRVDQVVNAINKFRDLVAKPNARVQDIIDAEKRMLEELTRAKAWNPVGSAQLGMGTIGFKDLSLEKLVEKRKRLDQQYGREPDTIQKLGDDVPVMDRKYATQAVKIGEEINSLMGAQIPKSVSYRKIGERLNNGEITKPQARAAVEAQLREFKPPVQAKMERPSFISAPVEKGEPEAAKVIADLLAGETTYAELLTAIQKALPESHPYQKLIRRLLAHKAHHHTQVASKAGWEEALGNVASVDIGEDEPVVTFDMDIINSAQVAPKRALHMVLHEMVHVATLGELGRSPMLRAAWESLRVQTYAAIRARPGFSEKIHRQGALEYGESNLMEFVAEVFTNPDLQNVMKETKVSKFLTLWQKFVDMVRTLIGFDPQSENLLDAALSLEDVTFGNTRFNIESGKGLKDILGSDMRANMKWFDQGTRDKIQPFFDRLAENSTVARGIKERAVMGGSNAMLSALTMRQIDKEYFVNFGGVEGPLRKYTNSFFARNADSSKLLEEADRLSRDWTKLEEANSAAAFNLSKLMRDATMTRIHPDQSFEEQELSEEQRDDWVALRSEWSALPPEARTLYQKLRDYYSESTKREVKLLLLNAIRASKFSEKAETLSEDDIDLSQELLGDWIEKAVGLDVDATKRLINEEENRIADLHEKGALKGTDLRRERDRVRKMEADLADSEEEVSLLVRMASLPQQMKGPYFPLMRFGDYAVSASKVVDTKSFTSIQARAAHMRQRRLEDPTVQFAFPEGPGFQLQELDVDFRLAETLTEAHQKRKELVEAYGEDVVSSVQLKTDAIRAESTIASNRALQSILGKLDGNAAAQAAIRQFYLQSLNDSSFRKREMHRKNIKGVEAGVQHRTFANYAKSHSYYTAQLRHGHEMAAAKGDMLRMAKGHKDDGSISALRMGQVVREIEIRDDQAADLHEVRPGVRKAVELGQLMLLFTPSYWMINLSQPYMITLPWLAGYVSTADALGALKSAQGLIMSPLLTQAGKSWGGMKAYVDKITAEESFSVLEKVIDQIRKSGRPDAERLIQMLEDLRRESVIDLSWIAELRDIAAGEGKSQWDRVMDATRVMAHLTEVNNRIMTAIAAYDIARSKGGNSMSHENAVNFAKRAVAETQFDYSATNKPRLFSANDAWWKPLVFQFMQFVQHSYFLMITNFRSMMQKADPIERKRAARTLVGMLMTHAAMGGLVGATIQPIKWAIGLTMMLFGLGDDEDRTIKNVLAGETYDRLVADAMEELLGKDLGEIARAGLPRAAGIDLSSRLELGRLYMIDLDPKNAETLLGSMLTSFAGPLTGIAANAYEGAQQMMDGNYQKGVERMLPKFGRDVVRTFRFANEGLTDNSGKVIRDAAEMSPLSLFATTLGFQPSEVAETYALAGAINDAKFYIEEQRERLMGKYNRAKDSGDLDDVMEDLIEFNKKYPEQAITVSQLLQSRKRFGKAEVQKQTYGATLSRREQYLAEEGEAYNLEE